MEECALYDPEELYKKIEKARRLDGDITVQIIVTNKLLRNPAAAGALIVSLLHRAIVAEEYKPEFS